MNIIKDLHCLENGPNSVNTHLWHVPFSKNLPRSVGVGKGESIEHVYLIVDYRLRHSLIIGMREKD